MAIAPTHWPLLVGLPSQSTLWTGILLLLTITITNQHVAGSVDVLPHPCDAYPCPPLDNIECPADSQMRKTFDSIALLEAITAAPIVEQTLNMTDVLDELMYAKCCVARKCACNTCYIPDCHEEGEVVVVLEEETMEAPGHCCGKYECQREPNCTEVHETESYWLRDCQRCKCYSGAPFCHQSCDEGIAKPAGLCIYKNMKREDGEKWRDGCEECECVHGEYKCQMSFCRSVNCPKERQINLQDSCCPICWPKGIPMPDGGEGYDYDEYEGMKKLPGLCFSKTLNKYFENDEHWQDGCHSCVCLEGKEQCEAKCPALPCEEDRQVKQKNACCPICWPNGLPMVSAGADDEHYDADDYDEDDEDDVDVDVDDEEAIDDNGELPAEDVEADEYKRNEVFTDNTIEPLPNVELNSHELGENTEHELLLMGGTTERLPHSHHGTHNNINVNDNYEVSTSTSTSTHHHHQLPNDLVTQPCKHAHTEEPVPATYQVYPKVVEVISPNTFLYIIIALLTFFVIFFGVWLIKMHIKKRSYRPVSDSDDFRAMQIKKTGDLA